MRKVLIADDHAIVRGGLKQLLSGENGFIIAGEAANGLEALKLFDESQKTVHLVISDIVMPQMGGIELYQTLRQRYPELKMLLITGHPLEEMNQKLLEKGQVNWLQKPFTVQDLNQAIQSLLKSGPDA